MVFTILEKSFGLGKPFLRVQNVVDLSGCYSNLEALNELVAAVSK